MFGTISEVTRLLVVVLVAGNVVALAAGLSLLLAPQRVAKWLEWSSDHPMSVRRLTKSLERPRDSEQTMLRYPRMLGGALLAGGIFVSVKWIFFLASLSVVDGGRMLMRLFPGNTWSAPTWESLWVTLLVLVLIGAVLAILVGGLALVRVQTLRRFSSFANRWISMRQAAKPVSRPYYGIDRLVAEHPQIWGGVITLLSIYTLAMILWFARGLVH